MRCEAGVSPDCTGQGEHTHHRQLRSQGGDDSDANTLRMCNRCHAWTHAHPEDSYRYGLMVRSWQVPEEVPVRVLREPGDNKRGHPGSQNTTGEPCRRCGGTGVLPVEPPTDKTERPKVTWAVRVPKDERENGHEVLETLVLECARLLGRKSHNSYRYYSLVEALAYFLQTYTPDE